MDNPNLPNLNNFAAGITESLFANNQNFTKSPITTQNFVLQSALYQNNNNPLFAAQREADALMATKQRRPMVFEYVKSLDQSTKEPIWESITMYINPEQMTISTQKIKAKQITRGGIYYHHWGDDHWAVSLSGTTGLAGMKGIEVLERVYHNSGTLLRYQAAGPVQQYPTTTQELNLTNEPYRVITFNSTTELLNEYMNDNTGKIKKRIQDDIESNQKATKNNEKAIGTYEERLARRVEVLNKRANQRRLIDLMPYNSLEKMTQFIDQMKAFEWYNNGYLKVKEQITKEYNDAINKNKNAKLTHVKVYNRAVQLVGSILGGINTGESVSLKANKTENVKITSAPELISSIALQITEEVIFLKENNALNPTLLKTIETYIADELNRNQKNKKNILKMLKEKNSPYNILRFYNLALKELKDKEPEASLKLESKVNIQDSIKRAFIQDEFAFLNQRSKDIDKYLDKITSNTLDGSPSSILFASLSNRQDAIKEQLEQIAKWEEKERILRNKLQLKALETMDDMFRDEWAPRRIIMYFENRAFIGHFESFSYRRAADKPLINYDLKFVAEKQILGTLGY